MTQRCSSCGRVLLWSGDRLVCANPHCTTGHQDLAATSRPPGRQPAALPLPAAGKRAPVFRGAGAFTRQLSVSLPEVDRAGEV